jgi:hypothetical protein
MDTQDMKKRPKQPKKVIMAPSSHEVRFADFFQITLAPSHGILKFGYFHPQSQEFIVHTQIALTPQGVLGLSAGLKKQLDVVQGQDTPFSRKPPDVGPSGPAGGDGGETKDQ